MRTGEHKINNLVDLMEMLDGVIKVEPGYNANEFIVTFNKTDAGDQLGPEDIRFYDLQLEMYKAICDKYVDIYSMPSPEWDDDDECDDEDDDSDIW
jgi:hypothetical protein